MSQVLKNSMSLVAVMASALSIVACSKHEAANKTESGAGDTVVVSAETKAAIADNECPTIIGTFTTADGKEMTYTMISVPGGVSLVTDEGSYIADGQSHTDAKRPSSTYVATCKDQVLTAVEKTTEAGKTTTSVSKMSVVNRAGDVVVEVEENGVGKTFPLKKVQEMKPFKLDETPLNTNVELGNLDLQQTPAAETAPAAEAKTAPAATETPAVTAPAAPATEEAPAASPVHEMDRADLRPMPSAPAASSKSMSRTRTADDIYEVDAPYYKGRY